MSKILASCCRPLYRKIFPDHIYFLKKELAGCHSVLDLGCGPDSSLQYCKVPYAVGVELFATYLKESQKKRIHSKYIKEDIRKVAFEEKSFDAVIMIDVLEHLTKDEGYYLLGKAGRWAAKKIVVFTPNGFVIQSHVDENPLQDHKSGWSVQDFKKLGFKVTGVNGWKNLRGPRAGFKNPVLLFRPLSELSQKIVRYFPSLAYHLFVVKSYE